MNSILFFRAPSRSGAELMATYFEIYCHCKLSNSFGAFTENDDFMLSADVPDSTIDEVMKAMQGLSRITGKMFVFQTVDEQFKMYRVTMIK